MRGASSPQESSDRAIAAAARERTTVPVRVFFLGPGGDELAKRRDVASRVLTAIPQAEIWIVEDMDKGGVSQLQYERELADRADVILVLLDPDESALGALDEIKDFFTLVNAAKMRVLRCDERVSAGAASPYYTAVTAEDYLAALVDQTRPYDRASWTPCNQITAACVDFVKRAQLRRSLAR